MLPVFTIVEHHSAEHVVVGALSDTSYADQTWVSDGWIGFLLSGDALVPGRWHAREDLWAFAPATPEAIDSLSVDQKWTVLDGHWGERAEIVLDVSREWRMRHFEPSDAVRVRGPKASWLAPASDSGAGNGGLIQGGWDHEHCAIDWETIGVGGQPDGYFSEPDTWVCQRCYRRFVEPRSLDFIPRT